MSKKQKKSGAGAFKSLAYARWEKGFLNTIQKEYGVDKTKIGFIRFIFEAHGGIAVVTTLDAATGRIRLAIARDRVASAELIIKDLQKDFKFDAI